MDLIEREDSLSTLYAGFRRIGIGEGHCFFVLGEAGIGKSALVKTFLSQVEKQSDQYVGVCDYLFTPRALAPLYDLALQMKLELGGHSQSDFVRTDLFTTFVKELMNRNKPVILVFEDIHWADEATLDFIKFFARRIARTRCMFILTSREEEQSAHYSLADIFADLTPDTFTRIYLSALSREAVHGLSTERGYDAENVYQISGGNPFYVNEILAHYSPGVPDNIKDAVLAVFNRRSTVTKNIWQTLSIIPEGLEIERLAAFDPSWNESIEPCFSAKILILRDGKIHFKHELYRLTIEQSLSPFRRMALNQQVLQLFLKQFEEKGEVVRIVHYAKNANEKALVGKYAPIAAERSAKLGAHVEAAKLYFTAIEYFEGNDQKLLAELYEFFTYESYLINEFNKAIVYEERALTIWEENNEMEKAGNARRILSRLWWFEGNHDKAQEYGLQAVELLQKIASPRSRAMAFANMSQLCMLSKDKKGCLEWGYKAIELAKETGDEETRCHALNSIGTTMLNDDATREEGQRLLLESLDIALKHSFHEQVARVYTNIVSNKIAFRQYDEAGKFIEDGEQYCEERELYPWKRYILSWKSKMLMETGDWKQAEVIAKNLLETQGQPAVNRIVPLTVVGLMAMRQGTEDPLNYLTEARKLAFDTKEHQRIILVMTALFEYEWMTGSRIVEDDEMNFAIDLTQKLLHVVQNSEFSFWMKKAGRGEIELPSWYEPFSLIRAGKPSLAASFWDKAGCPFEKAMALYDGSEDNKKEAFDILSRIPAHAVAQKLKMEMRSSGIKKIPRGIRESTRENPAQLTNREIEVLRLLKKGVQNREVAETLFISPKTVEHHISNILFKLSVNTRSKAVLEADRLGIITE